MMTRYHGITDKTYSRILIDAGQLRIGYVDESNPGALLGATRGGSVFAIEPDIRLMPVDGAKGDVKGDKRIARVNATITANVIELSAWVLALSLPGSTTDNYPDVTPTHNQIRRYLALAISKYRSTIALIGEIAGTGEPIVCILSNVIGTKGMSLALAENDEATLQMVFTAHFDPATMDAEPWEIRNPQEAADYLSFWKGENNGNNEVAGKPLAVWTGDAAYDTGKVGRAFSIAAGRSVAIATDPAYELTQYDIATLEFWFKLTALAEGESGWIFTINQHGGMLTLRYLYPDILTIWNVGSGGGTETEYPGVLTVGEWIKIKWVYDKATDLWYLGTSADGITWTLIASTSHPGAILPVTFYSGSATGSSAYLIDEIKITDTGVIPPAPPIPDFKWLKSPTEEGWGTEAIYIGGPSSDWAMNFQDYSTGTPITTWKWEVNNLIDSGWVEFSTDQNPRTIDIKGLVGTGYVIEFGTWNYKIKLTINGTIEAELDLYILWDAF